MRRLFRRLEVLAVVVVAICLAVLSGGQQPSRAQLQLASGPGGSLTLSNDKEAAAVLSLGGMRPGDSVTDTVTLGNTGTLDGDLSLATSNLVDTPGSGGGALSGKLDLRIRDVTVPASPVVVYNGKIGALTPVALGTLAAGAARVYEFRVFFPDVAPGAENAYQGSAVSVQFDWSAFNGGADVDPPETTITSGPPALSASLDATFAFTADESGSTFECSLDSAAFVSCFSPATFTGLSDGSHTFDVRATDSSTNTDPTPDSASWTIDATAPNVSLADPGSPLRGTVTLSPSAGDGTGSGIASLIIQRSPAGAGTWTTIGTSWDTTGVADGSYDLRARATDNADNAANSLVRTVVVDNTAPALVTSVPSDGELVAAAGSLVVTATENLSGIANATIDGAAAPAPLLAGATATYAAAFAAGPHTLVGQLEDVAGNRRWIAVHFTVWSLASLDYPWIEKNSPASAAISLTATNGEGAIAVPSGAWSGAPSGDWLVVRIDPKPAEPVPGGLSMAGSSYDVSAYWALAGTAVHSFSKALELTIPNAARPVVPATFESGAWRAIEPIPSGTGLPSGWQDGYYTSGSDVHILTKHLSSFALLEDVQAPTMPGRFKGARKKGRLVLSWKAATDQSGVVSAYLVYASGSLVKTVAGTARSVKLGAFKTVDKRAFQVAARDAAGNVGPRTRALLVVPALARLTVADAEQRLTARGLRMGKVTYDYSKTVASGRVIRARAAVAALHSAIPVVVSRGPVDSRSSNLRGNDATDDDDTPRPSTEGASPGGTAPWGGETTPTSVPTPVPTASAAADGTGGSGTGSGEPVQAGEAPQAGEVVPESFSSSDASPRRRALGLGLLAGAFLAAGTAAVRAGRPRPRVGSRKPVESLVFWDERLLHAVGNALRRASGRP
jgi:hypothetical protein